MSQYDRNLQFYKITNLNENHYGYQYQDGLNILDGKFNPSGSCVKGGLYFTTIEYLYKFYGYGCWIREITIPEDAQMVRDPCGNKWRADKIYLGNKWNLFEIETIIHFKLPINDDYLSQLLEAQRIDTLNYLLLNNFSLRKESSRRTQLFKKIKNKNIDQQVLESVINLPDPIDQELFEEIIIKLIKKTDDPDILKSLDRFENLDIKIKRVLLASMKIVSYDKYEPDFKCLRSLVQTYPQTIKTILLKKDNNTITFLKSSLDSLKFQIEILKILSPHCFSQKFIDLAVEYNSIKYLEFAKKQNYNFRATLGTMKKCKSSEMLKWWKNSGYDLEYNESIIHGFLDRGNQVFLQLWLNSGIPLKFNPNYYKKCKKSSAYYWWIKNKSKLNQNRFQEFSSPPKLFNFNLRGIFSKFKSVALYDHHDKVGHHYSNCGSLKK